MAVYLFTYHAYRSWNADRPQGFVLRGKGIQSPNVPLARKYDARASQAEATFQERHQRTILWITWDACERRSWRLHYAATDPSHVHLLVSWCEFQPWEQVRAKLKNVMAWALCKEFQKSERKWFVRGGSRKQIKQQQHFDYLMNVYLPRHRGLSWREENKLPVAPDWACSIGLGAVDNERK